MRQISKFCNKNGSNKKNISQDSYFESSDYENSKDFKEGKSTFPYHILLASNNIMNEAPVEQEENKSISENKSILLNSFTLLKKV